MQLRFINTLYIKILILFINLVEKTYKALLSIISNKFIMKKRNRIDNIKDSYEISVFTYNYLNLFLINLIIIIQSLKKLFIYFINIFKILLFLRLYISLLCNI